MGFNSGLKGLRMAKIYQRDIPTLKNKDWTGLAILNA
jgi:hypothetical protein